MWEDQDDENGDPDLCISARNLPHRERRARATGALSPGFGSLLGMEGTIHGAGGGGGPHTGTLDPAVGLLSLVCVPGAPFPTVLTNSRAQ